MIKPNILIVACDDSPYLGLCNPFAQNYNGSMYNGAFLSKPLLKHLTDEKANFIDAVAIYGIPTYSGLVDSALKSGKPVILLKGTHNLFDERQFVFSVEPSISQSGFEQLITNNLEKIMAEHNKAISKKDLVLV